MLDGSPFKGDLCAKLNIGTLITVRDIQHGFCQIPLDTYVHDGSRFKDIARFLIRGGSVIKTPHGDLFHPINSDTYGGYPSRTYAEIPVSDIGPLTALIEIFARATGVDAGREILLQRQRVINDDDGDSPTVREGLHQDGMQKLAILCVNRANVNGGINFIYDKRHDFVFAGVLEPGDILFIDDAQLWHDATPIRHLDPGRPGHLDVILLTWPACRKSEN